jgi:phenylacetate-CoA ligase
VNPKLLKLYHRLPPRARSAAATLHGWYLHRARYGKGSDELAAEARERDHWTVAQWTTWKQERLAYVLNRAARRVPFYREYWQERRRRGDRASWELLENWPFLEKSAVRTNGRAFLADDCDTRHMYHDSTAGTTGMPVVIRRSRLSLSMLYAILDTRTWGWEGIPKNARRGRLGGQPITALNKRRPPFWVWNAAMRQLYLSSFHLAPDLIPHYLDALIRYRVKYLVGYPSALYALAHEALRRKRTDVRLSAIHTNAEPLLSVQRETIAAAFECPVRETYGMAESVAGASECSAGRLHQWPEFGHVEVLPDGELICTGLLNPDMPLVRYRVGDRGQPPAEEGPCACGRSLPLMGALEGRREDVLVTPDGRLIGRLDPPFKRNSGVREAQIIQEQVDQVRVLLAPTPEFSKADEQAIIDKLSERLGDVRIVIETVDAVPRTTRGKLRSVISKLLPEERAAVLERGLARTP